MIKNLKLLRTKKGISQQYLANILGISQQSVNKYENHNVEPDIATLIAMSEFFGVSVDFLIGKSDNPKLSESSFSQAEKELVLKYRTLSDSEKVCVDTLISTYSNMKK